MFERFTARARTVIVEAQEAARSMQHNYIGTEHLLVGLLDVSDGLAARALHQFGLTAETVRSDIDRIIGRGDGTQSGHIPFRPRAKKVLELSLREALQLNHNYIGTEHILLAIIREGEGLAAKIMSEHIKELRSLRGTVLAMLSVSTEPGAETSAVRKSTDAATDAVSTAQALAGGAPMGSHHLLEALIRAEGSMAAKVLAALGVDPETVAAKIDELDPETTTDSTPEEVAARRMELRVAEGEVQLVFRDEDTMNLAAKVTELSGGPITGNGPISGAFVPLWKATNELLERFLKTLEPEEEDESRDVFAKASLMVRRVMRGRLQRREGQRPPEETA
jgi:ATP-dependent Clp protease ATP-binding subunit ClpA